MLIFSRLHRGAVLVLFPAVVATSSWISGCVGMTSTTANSNPVPQPTSAVLTVTPSTVSVAAVVGNTGSQTVTTTNNGKSSVAINQVSISGAGFTAAGLPIPANLAPGASKSFQVAFTATKAGTAVGSMAIMTTASSSPVVVQLSATASTTPSTPQPNPAPAPTSVTSIAVSPAAATAPAKGTITFSATVQGTAANSSVTWAASSGTITSTGIYSAPAAAGSATITATSVADTTKSASANVTITATPAANPSVTSVAVSPSSASVHANTTLQFSSSVQVKWKASSGTISSAGLYTAPASAGADTVTATSIADGSKSASAKITITPAASTTPPPATPAVSSISISPSSANAATNGTLQFSDSIQGSTTNKSVTWIAQRGTISSAGGYVAPSSPGTDTVTVTSAADSSKFATSTVNVSAPVSSGSLPAFPSAQGGGAASQGGRGGQVFEVTNLNDDGDGSLRACTSASGPRTCIFRVAGLISPSSMYRVENPFITIACQSAPGEVIIGGPRGNGSLFITTHDVTVRYCTFSSDNINIPAGPDTGTVNVEIANGDNYNIILDHVTSRWAGNKLWITLSNYVGPNDLITTQWSMFYEPHVNHPVGPGTSTNPNCTASSGSPCFSSGEHDIDFHHNLFADISHRIPESTNHSTRFVNNIIFNWNFYASEWLGAMTVDEIGNKYVAGNLNFQAAQKHEIHFTTLSPPLPGNPSTYLSGNIGPNLSDPAGNQYAMTAEIHGENGDEIGGIPSAWIRSSPMPAPAFPINADPVGNLDDVLLPTVGNSQHLDCTGNWVSHRDAADARIVRQYQTGGPGGYWPNALTSGVSSVPTPNSAWTDQPVTSFSACTESQHDGIPDLWKSNQSLSTTDPNLYKAKAPNGYTYLENYLNGPQ